MQFRSETSCIYRLYVFLTGPRASRGDCNLPRTPGLRRPQKSWRNPFFLQWTSLLWNIYECITTYKFSTEFFLVEQMMGGMPVTIVLFNLVRKKVLFALFRLQDRPVGLESNQTTTNLKRCVYVLIYYMLQSWTKLLRHMSDHMSYS